MNIEYMKLSDESIAVTDEKGKINIRNDNVTSRELIIENKIESLENKIVSATKKVNDYKGIKFVSKWMLIFQPIALIFATLIGYAIGNIILAIECFAYSCLAVIPIGIVWGISYPISKNKLKKIEVKLQNAEQLKIECEKELEEEKKLKLEKEEQINNPISLEEETKCELLVLDASLEKAYYNSIQNKPKALVLKRNSNKNGYR